MKSFLLALKQLLAPIFKTIPRIMLAGFLLFIFSCSSLNYSGFCWSQKRYLSDQEKIQVVVDDILSRYPPETKIYEMIGDKKIYLASRTRPAHPFYYKNKKEFFSANKGCCEAVKKLNWRSISLNDGEPSDISFWRRIFGEISDLVHVKYLVKYKDLDGDVVTVLHHSSTAVSSCGDMYNFVD